MPGVWTLGQQMLKPTKICDVRAGEDDGKLYDDGLVNGRRVKALVDTGSDVTEYTADG